MFTTSLRGWKKFAAGLMLLSGGWDWSSDASWAQSGPTLDRPGYPSKAISVTGANATTSAASPVETYRKLMSDARFAMRANDFARARVLAQQALELRVPKDKLQFWDESAEKMIAEIDAKLGKAPTAGSSNATSANLGLSGKEDARQLLKLSKEAIAANQLERAAELARKAQAARPQPEWGLFEDTPASVLQNIQKLRAKADKAEADRLMVEARKLYEAKVTTEAERRANYDKALELAYKAERLHGPYDLWDFGDRPAKLIAQIEAYKAKNRAGSPMMVTAKPKTGEPGVTNATFVAPPNTTGNPIQTASAVQPAGNRPTTTPPSLPNPPVANSLPTLAPTQPAPGGTPAMPSGTPTVPAGNGTAMPGVVVPGVMPSVQAPATAAPAVVAKPVAPAVDPRLEANRATAVQLMNEARALQKKGQYVAARTKALEAQKLNVPFAPGEVTPDLVLQDILAEGARTLNQLVSQARGKIHGKTPTAAELEDAQRYLDDAHTLATGLGLYTLPIDETRLMVRNLQASLAAKTTPAASTTVTTPNGTTTATTATTPSGTTSSTSNAAPNVVMPNVTPSGSASASASNTAAPGVVMPKLDSIPVGPTPTPTPSVSATPAPLTVTARSDDNMGLELLKKAELELKRGEMEAARRLAIEAHAGPYNVQQQAMAMLRTIDAEDHAQRKMQALRTYENAMTEFRAHNYKQALAMFQLIDVTMLPAGKQESVKEMMLAAQRNLQRDTASTGGVRPASNQTASGLKTVDPNAPMLPDTPMGSVSSTPGKSGADNLAAQVEALQEVQFQKLRADGLQAQAQANAKFGRGEADEAIKTLNDYLAKVKASGLDPNKIALLSRSAEARLETFKIMKKQTDFYAQEAKARRDFREGLTREALNEENKKKQVAELMKQYHELLDQGKYREAEMAAAKAHELDPDDASTGAAMHIAKIRRRQEEYDKIKSKKETLFVEGLNDAEDVGPSVNSKNPISFDPEVSGRNRTRSSMQNGFSLRTRSEKHREIEAKLNKNISLDFKNVPLSQVIDDLRVMSGMNIVVDTRALEEENIPTNRPISVKLDNISTRNALNIILREARLTHIIEDDVLKVTTERHARGKLVQRVFSVADLVIPVDNFAPPATAQMSKMLERGGFDNKNVMLQGITPTPTQPAFGLNNGQPTGTGTGGIPGLPGTGRLQNNPIGTQPASAIAESATVVTGKHTMEDALIKLITSAVRPTSWAEVGGPGTIDYYPIGMALVVNQTSDVIQEVADLLEALRRLQDLEVAVEVRLITLSETFFERIGLDFAMNLKTNTTKFEPQLTTNNFRPQPFINDINQKGTTIGLTPAGTFTPDLDIPLRATSFQYAIPPFGGYPNMPGFDGGISLGLAFLNDIQVYLFMEAAQGDRRMNVMQAPKLTMFNGQTASITVTDQIFFVTNVQVVSVNGQIVFVPQNAPFPFGLTMTVQTTVSADRRFVRMTLAPTLTNLASAIVPLFPITTFVTPVFEGGAQGQPIPFTQFIQQPQISSINLQTTVNVPDGGTVLLGGLKTLSEGRNEFGPPVLSKIPYVNRLFKNVGYGREAQSMMIMVTPRIIINREEEVRQTGQGDEEFMEIEQGR